MIRRPLQAIALLAIAALPAGCGKGAAPPTRVAMVAGPLGFGDRSYNDAARAGLAACSRESSTQTDAVVAPSAADYGRELTLLATENYDAVIALGYPVAPDVAAAARRFEKTHFALIDAVVDLPNVSSITFDEAQGSFLAGAAAALVSKTGTVGFLGGAPSALLERYEAGFTAGVRTVNPRTAVRIAYAGSFDDVAAGKRSAGALIARRADVVYAVAGRSGLGAIEAVQAHPAVYAIGVDSNQDALAPGKVLTSVVKRVDVAALRVCREAHAQKPLSGHVVLGVADGAIGLTDFAYTRGVIGAAGLARLERIRRLIAAGTIRPPQSRAELRAFRVVAAP
jgi:basic membrane protein A